MWVSINTKEKSLEVAEDNQRVRAANFLLCFYITTTEIFCVCVDFILQYSLKCPKYLEFLGLGEKFFEGQEW